MSDPAAMGEVVTSGRPDDDDQANDQDVDQKLDKDKDGKTS